MKYKIGGNSLIEKFVLIGVNPKNAPPTIIGKNAVIRSHSIIYAGNKIGDNFQTGHGVLVREFNEIGDGVSIGSHSVIEHHVKIDDNVRIHSGSFIPEYSRLEEGCWIGPGVLLTNAKYPSSPLTKNYLIGPIIRKNAKVGAGAIILPGVIIGIGVLVGAGSVVTKDVPDGAVVAGNPAQIINQTKNLVFANGEKPY